MLQQALPDYCTECCMLTVSMKHAVPDAGLLCFWAVAKLPLLHVV